MPFSVYCHTNKINGKRYVGITSQSVHARWQNGKKYVRHSKFYADILKYGWNNFEHRIVCSGLSREDAEEIEKNLIEGLNLTCSENGYNCEKGGIHTPNLSFECKEKLSELHKGENNPFYNKKHTAETKHLMSENRPKKAVVCVETGVVYKSTREAERQTKADHSDIIKCCKGMKKTAGGFHWSYREVI